MIELAAVLNPQLSSFSAIAQTLGVRDQDSTPLPQRLQAHLHNQLQSLVARR
ncbi:MAG: hypothetical protein R2911_41235 [Caldilineaceae bacterium]